MNTAVNPTSRDFPRAQNSIWYSGRYTSPSDIGYEEMREILSRHTREDKRARLVKISTWDIRQILAAYTCGKLSHGYKTVQRRRSWDRYIDHPKAVALIGFLELNQRNPHLLSAEMLHDTREDTVLTIELLERISEETLRIVQMLTNPKKWDDASMNAAKKEAHYRIITGDREASQGKVSDRIHNLRTLEVRIKNPDTDRILKSDIDGANRQLEETARYILPMAKGVTTTHEPYLPLLEREMHNVLARVRDVDYSPRH